jgi:hypothetical protein
MLFLVGGRFSKEGVVDAAANRGEHAERVTVGGRPAVRSKSKKGGDPVWLGQADDGAILFSNDEPLLAAAMKRSDAHKSVYQLDVGNELGFVVASAFVSKQAKQLEANPFTRGLLDVSSARGSLGFTAPGGKIVLATASPAKADALEKEISGLLALARLGLDKTLGASQAGEADAIKQAKLTVVGSDVVIELPWTAQGVDQAMKLVADGIREAQKQGFKRP